MASSTVASSGSSWITLIICSFVVTVAISCFSASLASVAPNRPPDARSGLRGHRGAHRASGVRRRGADALEFLPEHYPLLPASLTPCGLRSGEYQARARRRSAPATRRSTVTTARRCMPRPISPASSSAVTSKTYSLPSMPRNRAVALTVAPSGVGAVC